MVEQVERAEGKQEERSKLKGHLSKTFSLNLPQWVLYICAAIALLGLIYGTVQQFRVWRWGKLLDASKVRIAELEAEKQTIALEIAKKYGSQAIRLTDAKIKVIDQKLKKLKEKKKTIQKDVKRMDPKALLDAFRKEGF